MNTSFAKTIFNKKINLDQADEDRVQLLIQIMDFKMNTKPQNHEKKDNNDIKKNSSKRICTF